MPLILVVEQEGRHIERIRDTLLPEGYDLEIVDGYQAALGFASARGPDLVLVNVGLANSGELLETFSRRGGGPGAIAMIPEARAAESGRYATQAEASLVKPFAEQELRLAVRRSLAAAAAGPGRPRAAAAEHKLTSEEIFGDLLAEVEREVAGPAAAQAARSSRDDDEIQRKLEMTLSGVMPPRKEPAARAPAARKEATGAPAASAPAAGTPAGGAPGAGAEAPTEPEAAVPEQPAASGPRPPAAAPVRAAGAPDPPVRRRRPRQDVDVDALLSATLSSLDLEGGTGTKTPPVTPGGARPAGPSPRPGAGEAGPFGLRSPDPSGSESGASDAGLAAPTDDLGPGFELPELDLPVPEVAGAGEAGDGGAEIEASASSEPAAVVEAEASGPDGAGGGEVEVEAALPEPVAAGGVEPPGPEITGTGSASGVAAAAAAAAVSPQTGSGVAASAVLDELPEELPDLGERTPDGAAASVGSPMATQRIPTVRPAEDGQAFGQYALLDKIAVGGMAEVWKARMQGVEGFQKTVAIKKILAHLTDSADFVTMFIDEAKLAAQLNHPNITHIYDLGKIGEAYYIAMEYVEGRNLRSILNAARRSGTRIPPGLAMLVTSRLASALDYAHRKRDFDNRELGLVHRDVSPQNVLISYEGDIKLCDFGIVKAVSKASHTQMGALKGKLQYMSPEQAWGRQVDPRSDIFSLGVLLFEMLTGQRLFAGDNEISVLEAVRECRVQRPGQVDPTLPAEVDDVVEKALRKDPDDRYASAGEMQQRLERVLFSLRPTPTQAELATFMQELFGAEGGETEAAGEARPAAGAVEASPAPVSSAVATPAPSSASGAQVEAVPAAVTGEVELEEGGAGGRRRLIAAIVVAVVVLGLLALGYFVLGWGAGDRAEPQPPAESTQPAAGSPAAGESGDAEDPATLPEGEVEPQPQPAAGEARTTGPAAAPTGPTEREAAAQPVDIESMVDEELTRRETELRRQLEAEQQRLEGRLAQARQAGEETREPPPAEQPAPQPAAAEPAPAARSGGGEPDAAAAAGSPDRPTEATQDAVAGQPDAAQPTSPTREEARQPQTEEVSQGPRPPPQEASGRPTRRPEPAAPPPQEPPEPAQPAVEVGELVKLGPGVTPPALVSISKPQYPPLARRLKVEGVVEVSLLVDENGSVEEVELSKPITADVGINEAALQAARTAKFRPATKDGVRVKIWWKIRIPFKL